MIEGKRHFREILASDEKISTNILTDRLMMLEAYGILHHKADPSHKQKKNILPHPDGYRPLPGTPVYC